MDEENVITADEKEFIDFLSQTDNDVIELIFTQED